MNEASKLAGININKDPIAVKHRDLEREGDSMYRSSCPVCKEGILIVGRDQKTFQLLEDDNCILCGQRFIYSDIGSLEKK